MNETKSDLAAPLEVIGVINLINRVGIYKLGGVDGCPCTDFSVRGVNVVVSCHKSNWHGIKVWSTSMDFCGPDGKQSDEMLRPIADEVLRQVGGYYGSGGQYAASFPVFIGEQLAVEVTHQRAIMQSAYVDGVRAGIEAAAKAILIAPYGKANQAIAALDPEAIVRAGIKATPTP